MSNNMMYKLATGETIIANNFVSDLENNEIDGFVFIELFKPLSVILQQSQSGLQFGLVPWLHDGATVRKNVIVGYSPVPAPIEQEYIKATTGIQLAS